MAAVSGLTLWCVGEAAGDRTAGGDTLRAPVQLMSRAFVREDDHEPEPTYDLPERDSPYYPEAAAWALIQGADAGDSRSAERATGFRWGDPALTEQMEAILERADAEGEDRVAQLARRFLRAARHGGD